jgi:hypothetical protein
MRICLTLKGAFSINDIRRKLDDTPNYNQKLQQSMDNLKEKIIKPLEEQGHTIDILCSTYDTTFINTFVTNFPVKKVYKFPTSSIEDGGDWNRQILHYMKLNEMVYEIEASEPPYDLFIYTRFDLLFLKNITEWDLNFNEFNITFLNSSGNCDDNIFIFNHNYLNAFADSMHRLYMTKDITHAINRRLVERDVPIHYMYAITEEDYIKKTEYKLYALNRNG